MTKLANKKDVWSLAFIIGAVILSLFQIITGWQPLPAIYQRMIHVFAIIALIMLKIGSQRRSAIVKFFCLATITLDKYLMIILTLAKPIGRYLISEN